MNNLNYWISNNKEDVYYLLDKINKYLETNNIIIEDKKKFNNDIVNHLYKIRYKDNKYN